MSGAASTQAIELAIAVAIVRLDAGAGWTPGRLATVTGHPLAEVKRVIQSMRFAGRLSMAGYMLSATMRDRAVAAIAAEKEQDSVAAISGLSGRQADAAGAVTGESGGVATAGGHAPARREGATAAPCPTQTPAVADTTAGEPSYHSGARAVARREVMARQVLAVLSLAADKGEPCPKNALLCAAFKGSTSEVPAVLARLKESGAIRVEREGRRRRVTIVATGKATDWSLPDERGVEVMPQHLIEAREAEAATIEARRVALERQREAQRRAALAAEERGRVPAPIALQAVALADRASSVGAALQGAWPDTWRLLVRLSVAQSVRPLVLIDRLIREEAAREGVRTPSVRHAPAGDDDDDLSEALAGDDGGPRDILDEGNWS